MKKVLIFSLIVFLLGSAFAPIFNIKLTPEFLALRTGAFVSLVFSFFPGLNTWYAGKPENFKKLFMIGALVVFSAGLALGMCAGLIAIEEMTCTSASIESFLNILLLAIVANQATYKLTPQTSAVVRAKELSKE